MFDTYKYIDADLFYVYPDTGVLKNIPEINDFDSLTFFESVMVASRLQELNAKPIKIQSSNDLLRIHKYLFQDVYSWAGRVRTVEISKNGKPFLPTQSFQTAFGFINSLLNQYFDSDRNKKEDANSLAVILDNINFMHPFREGNGRTQREFIRILALQKKYVLDLNPLDDKHVHEQYMRGTIDGDVEKLSMLIFNSLN